MPLVEELEEIMLELRWHREQRTSGSGGGVGAPMELARLEDDEVELLLELADILFWTGCALGRG